jgi:hypothetical protein
MKFVFTILLCFIFSFISYGQFNSNQIFKAVWVDFTKDGDVNFKVNFELDIDTINISKFDYSDSILYNLKEQINIDYVFLEKKIRDSIANIYFVQKEMQNRNEYNGVLKFFATNNDMPYAIYKLKYGQENFIKEYFPENNFENTQRAEKFKSIIGTFWYDSLSDNCIEVKSNKILIFHSFNDYSEKQFEYELEGELIKYFNLNEKIELNFLKNNKGSEYLKEIFNNNLVTQYKKITNYNIAKSLFDEKQEKIKEKRVKNLIGTVWYNFEIDEYLVFKSNKSILVKSISSNKILQETSWEIYKDEINYFDLRYKYDTKLLEYIGQDGIRFLSEPAMAAPHYLKFDSYSFAKTKYDQYLKKLNIQNKRLEEVSNQCQGDMRILDKQIKGTAKRYQESDGHYYYQVTLWVILSESQKKNYSYLKYSATGASRMNEVKKSIGEKIVINRIFENTMFTVMPELKCIVNNQFVFGVIYFRDLKKIN